MILDEIRKHPFTTRQQLAKVIGITPDGIKKQLEKLKKAKAILSRTERKGGSPQGGQPQHRTQHRRTIGRKKKKKTAWKKNYGTERTDKCARETLNLAST